LILGNIPVEIPPRRYGVYRHPETTRLPGRSPKPDYHGGTVLSYAGWDVREGVVRIPLGQEQVSPD